MLKEKEYRVYVYDGGDFDFAFKTSKKYKVKDFIDKESNRYKFIRVNNMNVFTDGNGSKRRELVNCYIYLGGVLLKRKYEFGPDYIEKLKETLTGIYKLDGSVLYMPKEPLGISDVRELLNLNNDEWFHMRIIKETPLRYVLVTFDWDSHTINRKKILNRKATEHFGVELYGNVLFIDENLVA